MPFSLLRGVVVFGERLSLVRLSRVVLAVAGVLLLVFDPAIVGELGAVGLVALPGVAIISLNAPKSA